MSAFPVIPEFIGRLPVLARLHPLSQHDLLRVLTEPQNAIVKQHRLLMRKHGAELTITRAALEAISSVAVKSKTGARGLMGHMVSRECQSNHFYFYFLFFVSYSV